MRSMLKAGAVSAVALASLWAAAGARAEDKPDTGVPEESIAQELPYDAARASLAAAGIRYGINYTGEYYNVASGGVSRSLTYNGLVEGYVDLDLERLFGWKGAAIHANAFYVHGIGPTTNTGSAFAVSNLEGLEALRLDELWLEQSLLDDKLKFRFGSIAADTEFFISDTSAVFFNGTFGWAGILATNMVQGGPSYPLTSMGASVAYTPNDNLTILAGIFNGSPANPDAADPQKSNRHGVDFRFGDGALLLVEGAFKYDVGLPGTVKVGGWRQFDAPDGIYFNFRTKEPVSQDSGLYAIVDQQIWKNGDNQSVSIFGRVSGSPENHSLMDMYFDTGILFSGFVPGRSKDVFGAAFGYGQISSDALRYAPDEIDFSRTFESVLELNYTAHIRPGITLQPDFQYFWNPGAVQEVGHAAVFGARARISY
ncbi:carbohydrate-selective porin OprB [Hyphomicrobium denitrificans 1NES1]|uniref:Carbohydrate-selective porin OprB n=1 Tax=Hyphomicrobium denitrificans 1NES1 TaxID=670307 RepID=N0B498_9HYPH|nr:carbohydrate porin [Hyphomicrobium denitrificans]AGK58354.1 carbohydrate-selective porin OprB [Hyphomicrobium denitrificans 1NES1]